MTPITDDINEGLNEPETPLSPQEWAARLRKWADVLDIPSGQFVNEDLQGAADALESLSRPAPLGKEIEGLIELLDDIAKQGHVFGGWSDTAGKAAAALRSLSQRIAHDDKVIAGLNKQLTDEIAATGNFAKRIAELTRERDKLQAELRVVYKLPVTMEHPVAQKLAAERDSLKQSARELAAELGRQSTARGKAEEQLETIEARTIGGCDTLLRGMAWTEGNPDKKAALMEAATRIRALMRDGKATRAALEAAERVREGK